MKTLQISGVLVGGALALLVSSCAGQVTTPELIAARNLMAQARSDDTARRNPAGLHVAEVELAGAEAAHQDDPGSAVERDRAYMADRRIRIAMANARRSVANERAGAAQTQYTQQLEQTTRAQNTQMVATQTALDQSRTQVAVGTQQLDASNEALRTTNQQLTAEHDAHAVTQDQLALTTAELNEVASVRQEQEDLIITLSNAVLFGTGQTGLLPDAERRLTAIASVIRSHPDRRVTVVGYTDSRGNATNNITLSLARANVVREDLARDVPAAHIDAQGAGATMPVGDNHSADGRASNRRVEIVMHRAEVAPGATSQR